MRVAVFVRFRDKASNCVIGGRKRLSMVFRMLLTQRDATCLVILRGSVALILQNVASPYHNISLEVTLGAVIQLNDELKIGERHSMAHGVKKKKFRKYRFLVIFWKWPQAISLNPFIKAGVHVNRWEIWSNIKRKLLGLKWGGNTVDPPKDSPRLVGACLVVFGGVVGACLVLILDFKFQFSKSIKSSTFHIFLNLAYPLRKNISFPKYPKGHVKRRQNSLHVYPRLN